MKKIFTYILVAANLLSLFSCIQREDVSLDDIKVDMVFSAKVADIQATKTVIDGNIGDGYRNTLWLPGDSIAIANIYSNVAEKFVNTRTTPDVIGIFEGSANQSDTYFALYPYSAEPVVSRNTFKFDIPSMQEYTPDSFASNAAPMVAKVSDGEGGLDFYNLCGVLVIKLTGEEKVNSVSFSSKDESGNWNKISGEWRVNMEYDSIPEIISTDNSELAVTVYSDEGVQLDPNEAVPFYMVLPPSNHNTFVVTVTTTDGKIMIKEATKPLTIKRANVTVSAPLIYTETIAVDLSEDGTSNCYIVSEPGVYSIDASTIGNGVHGIIEGVGFHTDNPYITPVSAEILWTDIPSVITSATCDSESGKITFMTLGVEGNAVIAAKDENGTILWSWHIWCTDAPEVQTYTNSAGTFNVLDRNLGATSAGRVEGATSEEYMGTLYFWGRKDPFHKDSYILSGQAGIPISYTVANPVHTHTASSWSSNLSWMVPHINVAWSDSCKTIYDPCPSGYKVPTSDIWSGFSAENVASVYDDGWSFYIDEDKTSTAWYPFSRRWLFLWSGYDCQGIVGTEVYSKYWSSNNTDGGMKVGLTFKKVSDTELEVIPMRSLYDSYGLFVRCMKDDAIYSGLPRLLTEGVDSVTVSSALVKCKILYEGFSPITERGIVWGSSSDIDIDNGTLVKSEGDSDEYTIRINDLQHSTTYYARAYAVNGEGVSYGSVMTFSTEFVGETVDLSQYGTANSYIVPKSGIYKFKTTKGNSSELIEGVVSADVLWTSFGTLVSPQKGELVSKVEYSDGYVSIYIPSPLQEGNAIISVKDANGNILWSWHIWLVDFDPEATARTYQSGAIMMDRNLGATSVQDQDPKAFGLLYQWGRKDPAVGSGAISGSQFAATYPSDFIKYEWNAGSLEYSIQNPATVIGGSTWNIDNSLWTSKKTIYDPCPLGWRVPDGGPGVWSEWKYPNEKMSNGVIFKAPYSIPDTYYPQGGYTEGNTSLLFVGRASYNWSCTPVDSSDYSYNFHFWSGYGRPMDTRNRHHQYSVRCQKDIEYEKESLPVVVIKSVSDITTSSANLLCEVESPGYDEVLERGVILSTSSDVSLDNGEVVKSGSGTGEYTVSLSLDQATRYYVMAYATTNLGTSYSETVRVTTESDGTFRDLSDNGTANSYIVPQYGYYSFDASVKGNGLEVIEGVPVSAEVLWETRNTVDSVSVGDVIQNVAYKDGRITFNTSDDFNQGNALVAVKDGEGVILWSWHIWVVEYNCDTHYHNYPSGAVMMDRNLGALSNGTDVLSNGLIYQWGRKDPFMGAGSDNAPAVTAPESVFEYVRANNLTGTIRYASENPTAVLFEGEGGYWLYDSEYRYNMWNKEKGVYDPCPPGWIVPRNDIRIWDRSTYEYPRQSYSIDGVDIIFGDDYWMHNGMSKYNYYDYSVEDLLFVRCERERNFSVHTLSFTSTPNSVTVSGRVVTEGDREIKEAGVVIGEDEHHIFVNYCTHISRNSGETVNFGNIDVTVNELKSNTSYYARTYAITENGIEYGETILVNTKSTGNNEGVGDDDYEW